MVKYRPMTGAVRTNVTLGPISSGMYYRNGYVMSVQNPGAETTVLLTGLHWEQPATSIAG